MKPITRRTLLQRVHDLQEGVASLAADLGGLLPAERGAPTAPRDPAPEPAPPAAAMVAETVSPAPTSTRSAPRRRPAAGDIGPAELATLVGVGRQTIDRWLLWVEEQGLVLAQAPENVSQGDERARWRWRSPASGKSWFKTVKRARKKS